jgi:hypothetical protein
MRCVAPPITELTARAQTLSSAGDLVGARAVLATALDPADVDPQRASPDLATAAALHARVLIALGDPHAARLWAAFAHAAEERLHGPQDERTISAAATHAAVLQRVGNYGRSAQLYHDLVGNLTTLDGPDAPRVLAAEADLATAEHAAGHCTAARARLTAAWRRHRQVYGDDTPSGIKMLARLGAMERECGRVNESREHLALAQELCARYLPADHPLAKQAAALAVAPASGRHVCGRVARSTGPDPAPGVTPVQPQYGGVTPVRGSLSRPEPPVPGQPVPGQPVPGGPFPSQSGPSQPGPGQPASAQAGPGRAGSADQGSPWPDQAAPGDQGSPWPDQAAPGDQAAPWPDLDPPEPVWRDRAGQERAGPQAAGPQSAGARGAGPDRAGPRGAGPETEMPPPDERITDPKGAIYQAPLYLSQVHQAPGDLTGRHARADTPPPLPGQRPEYGPDGRRVPVGTAPVDGLAAPVLPDRRLPVPVEKPDQRTTWPPLVLIAVLVAGIAVAAAVVAATLPRSGADTLPPAATASAPAAPAAPAASAAAPTPSAAAPTRAGVAPADVKLRDNRDSVSLDWSYPKGAEGPVLISGGRVGQERRAFQQLPAGTTSYVVYGLNNQVDYCFTVAVVYTVDQVAASKAVCTKRH